jgi:hypothetical protein
VLLSNTESRVGDFIPSFNVWSVIGVRCDPVTNTLAYAWNGGIISGALTPPNVDVTYAHSFMGSNSNNPWNTVYPVIDISELCVYPYAMSDIDFVAANNAMKAGYTGSV